MARGDRKRKQNGFQKGHLVWAPKKESRDLMTEIEDEIHYVRPTMEEAELMTDTAILPAAMIDGATSATDQPKTKILRPVSSTGYGDQSAGPSCIDPENCYKLFHCARMWEMMNSVFKQHREQNSQCTGNLHFDPCHEEQRGLCWRQRAVCSRCSYQSAMFKLYMEVPTGKRGRKSATANIGSVIGSTQTPIAAASLRKILMSANIPAPSESGLQRTANKVSKIITETNKKDMQKRRQQLKKINNLRNMPTAEIAIQSDGTYNNSLYSAVGKNPFQAGTKTTYIVAENMTTQHQIISAEFVNKLCSVHGIHSKNETCTSEHCSATASFETSIGDEQRWAESCYRDIISDGLTLKYITTDGDTKAYQAALSLYEENLSPVKPQHQLDTRHLTESQRRQIKNSPAVCKMMPGGKKEEQLFLQGRFALDLPKRCQAEFNHIHQEEGGDLRLMLRRTNTLINVIKYCYGGDHRRCQLHSFVCKGKKADNWIIKSNFLPKNFTIDLSISENDETLTDCIEFRLGQDTVQLTKLNTNTQKVEATNRAIKRSLPKTSTFPRNYVGRASSAIHAVNNGPGQSIKSLVSAAGCPIPVTSTVNRQLSQEQRRSEERKEREKSMSFKLNRNQKICKKFQLYEKNREEKKYIKSQLLKKLKGAHEQKIQNPEKPVTPKFEPEDHDYMRTEKKKNSRTLKKTQGGSCPPKH